MRYYMSMCWPYGRLSKRPSSGLHKRQCVASSASSLRLAAARRFIRELVDLLAVYREHEPARVSDSRIRRQVAASSSIQQYPIPFAVPSLKHGATITINITSQILLLLFFKCSLFFLASNESLISPRRSKGDDPLSLPFPLLFAFFFLHRLHDGGEGRHEGLRRGGG
ncbi:uncharacterized protein TrAtP1_004012 [Trichoderma atroviride]|uniref:uncharacterized protein n=1 Tax=Hypocrea atroviridis TaxID=63577 RepID=UPI00332068E6|nr:hypothetical protein TrAtP1_004012 [Trichoderma atroviride]